MHTFWQDVRYGLRMLGKNPAFTAIAVLTLALGIGANTAIFSVIDAVLLRPLPFKNPAQLVSLGVTENAPGNFPLTGDDYLDWQEQNHAFSSMSLYGWDRGVSASSSGGSEPATLLRTQGNFFSTLGVQPFIGRTFAEGEDQEGKNLVAILSYRFWQEHFGGRAEAIGEKIQLDEEAYTVIGVMPRWFNFPESTEIWAPQDMSKKELGGRGNHQWRALGRVKDGTSIEQARADLVGISERLSQQYRDKSDVEKALVTPLQERLVGDTQSELALLLAAVGVVLLVACANVANLMLARSTGRVREVAVRATLGATRWRLMRQLLTESVLLSLAGAALGTAGAIFCVDLLESAKTLPIPRANAIEVNVTVLLFTAGVSVFVGLLFGLAPALHVSSLGLSEELKSSAQAVLIPSGWRRVLRDVLVVGEVAVSLALLVAAGLLLRSFARMRTANIGVQAQNVLTLGINLPAKKYEKTEQKSEFFGRLLQRVSEIPGVEKAALSADLPLESQSNGYITVPGDTNPQDKNLLVAWGSVTPDYFSALGIPVLEGRALEARDDQQSTEANEKIRGLYEAAKDKEKFKAPDDISFVAVINHTMAETFWPKQDAVGREFLFSGGTRVRVVGVVGDVKQWGITEKTLPEAYFPVSQVLGWGGSGLSLVVKTRVPPTSVIEPIRNELQESDSALALFRPRTMEQVISDNMQDASLRTLLLGVFSGLALVLAAIGLYGVMAYLVTQRTHEIGIRMALGAEPGSVRGMILRQGAKLTVLGVAIGLVAAFGLTRLMAKMLFGVGAHDPFTFGAVAALLMLVAMLACYIPARRATRVDPMVALRYE